MTSANGIDENTECKYTEDTVGDYDESYIVGIKNKDGSYTYTIVKVRPEKDDNGNINQRAGTSISFSEFDINSLATSMKNGKINDDLEASLMACIHGTKKNDNGKVVTADANDNLIDYFRSSTCQANYLIANIAIQKDLENPELYKDGTYYSDWTFDQFDDYCQKRLKELEEAGIVTYREDKDDQGNTVYKVTLNINTEDGLSQDEIDALMCVTTGNPTLLSFGAETQAHADMYHIDIVGFKRGHTVKADMGVDENKESKAYEDPYKRYYTTLDINQSPHKGVYYESQEYAFGDKAYEYIDGYPK